MLSKKYCELLAELIGKSVHLNDFTARLVIELKNDNPEFDTAKFINYIEHIRGQVKGV